jgi:hypothetical protein
VGYGKGFAQRREEEALGRQAPHPFDGAADTALEWNAASRLAQHLHVFASLRGTKQNRPCGSAPPLFKRINAV